MLNLRTYLAIPYKHKGRDFSGCDCLGLIKLYFREELKKDFPDILLEYSPNWGHPQGDPFRLEGYYNNFTKVDPPKRFDVIAFQNPKGIVNHGGVVLGGGKFIHCCEGGVMVDSYTDERWKKRINGFYRLK